MVHCNASRVSAESGADLPGDKYAINRRPLRVRAAFGIKPGFVRKLPWLWAKHLAPHVHRKIERDQLFDLDKINVVVAYHKKLPCVTFKVSVPGVLLILELSLIAARGWVYVYATDVADVAAVKFGSEIHVTAELGVCITSSNVY